MDAAGRVRALATRTVAIADDDWRARILAESLVAVFLLGVVTSAVTIVWAAFDGSWLLVAANLTTLAVVGFLAFSRHLHYRGRAIGLLCLAYALGLYFLFTASVMSLVYLMALPVLTAVLRGLRAAVVACAVTGLTLLVLGPLTGAGDRFTAQGVVGDAEWAVIAISVLFVATTLSVVCGLLLGRLERSLAEQRRSEARVRELAMAVDQASDVVLVADPAGTVVYANRAHDAVAADLGPGAAVDRLDRVLPAEAVTPAPWTGRVTWSVTGDRDAERVLDATLAPTVDDAGQVVNLVAVLRDVTAIDEIERRLARAQRLEALGTLASGVAHDFNNVIAAILGLAEQIRDAADEAADPSVAATRVEGVEGGIGDHAALIVAACDRARDVVRQMMVFGRRPGQGSPTPGATAVRAADAIDAAVPLLRAAVGNRVEIRRRVLSDASVLVDPADVHQMLANLVSNAAHSMAHLSDPVVDIVVRRATIHALGHALPPRLDPSRAYVSIEVRDTGTGIAPDDLDRVFDPFFTRKAPDEGTGLGLASVHAIATSLGGDVTVSSRVGVGTTFWIYLPEYEPRSVTEVPADQGTPPPSRPTGLRVLVVDDEPVVAMTSAVALRRVGHQVVTASDGDEALALVAADPDGVDVVVTDVTMPGRSGPELVRALRELRPDLPVVLMSGFGVDIDIDGGGADGYLSKPFDRERLVHEVHRVAGRT